jgi:Terminase DNA packaging enzyme
MSDANNDPISQALNLAPMPDSISSIVARGHDDSAKTDFNLARANIHEVIQNGSHAIDRLSQIADSSQHPRAFEVLAKLMDTMLQANKDLLQLQKQIREIDSADAPMSEQAKSVTNNLFVGSTAELQKVLKDMKNGSNS